MRVVLGEHSISVNSGTEQIRNLSSIHKVREREREREREQELINWWSDSRTRSTTSSTLTLTSTFQTTRRCWSWVSQPWKTTMSALPCSPPSATTSPDRTASPWDGARRRVSGQGALQYIHVYIFYLLVQTSHSYGVRIGPFAKA